MQQSLENVISKLQKIYQLKSLELEHIHEELSLRKIATALANFKESDEISSYDLEKVSIFLTKTGSDLDLEVVALSCTIVALANPVVKTSKRYLEASNILFKIKESAITYIETRDDLFLKQTQYENLLKTMEDLFNVLTNKIVVSAESLEVYIKLLETEVFKDDKYSVLVVVAALVIRNATLLSNPEKITKEEPEIANSFYTLDESQQSKKEFYEKFIAEVATLYNDGHRGMVTNTYLKNIEVLIEKKKINFEEAKEMLNSDSKLYEYFLWNWMSKLVEKMNKLSSSKEANSVIEQLDRLKEKYDDVVERSKISNLVKNKVKNTKNLIYHLDEENQNAYFNVDDITEETRSLLNQLKDGKDTKKTSNITSLDNDLMLLMGEQEFILFRKLPRNHTLILLNGKIEEMDKCMDEVTLNNLSESSFYEKFKNILSENGVEYRKMMQESEKLESKIFKKDK